MTFDKKTMEASRNAEKKSDCGTGCVILAMLAGFWIGVIALILIGLVMLGKMAVWLWGAL